MNLEKAVELVEKVAEKLGQETAELAPFLDEWMDNMSEAAKPEMDEAELVKTGTRIMELLSPFEEQGESEPQTDDETVEAEAEEPAEVELVEPEEIDIEALQGEICIILDREGNTAAGISKELKIDKQLVNQILADLEKSGLVSREKRKKTWTLVGVEEETDASEEIHEEADTILPSNHEPHVETSSDEHAALKHALDVHYTGLTDLVITAVSRAQQSSSENNAYKAQAEQYTEVMKSLRGLLDEIQTSEQYKLHDPLWQRVARIAEWQPEA